MKPQQIYISPFQIAGLSVRTKNMAEINPETAKIATLWQQFFEQNTINDIHNKLPNTAIYGVYSNYQSDASDYYDIMAGVAVSEADPNLSNVIIQEGNYLVFKAQGAMPQTVIQLWQDIWQYFEENDQQQRLFATDFEMYLGTDQINIYIGIH